ncbi:hypothetical protein EDD16DRAFT_1594977 [Pisolithus croceorrhizus]|nr:hypothetical protein EDD16DRAFT_1594977 [Pisolithus croceorrhizus]
MRTRTLGHPNARALLKQLTLLLLNPRTSVGSLAATGKPATAKTIGTASSHMKTRTLGHPNARALLGQLTPRLFNPRMSGGSLVATGKRAAAKMVRTASSHMRIGHLNARAPLKRLIPPPFNPRTSAGSLVATGKRVTVKNGSGCKFSHENEEFLASERQSTVEADDTSTIQYGFRNPCRYWKAGNCKNGSDCIFSHGNEDPLTSDRRGASTGATKVVSPPRIFSQGERKTFCRYWKAGYCMRGDVCWFRHADNNPTDSKTAQKEAVTIGQVVQNSIITCGAGLDIIALTAGFESCTLYVKNMTADAKEGDLRALMSQQGVDADRLYLVGVKGVGGRKVEVGTMTDSE